MGFSVAHPASSTTLLAEISLAQNGASQEAEGLTLPQELLEPELLKEPFTQGTLRGESKAYTFILEKGSTLPQKLADSLSGSNNRPQLQKPHELKSSKPVFSFKENLIKEKTGKGSESTKENNKAPARQISSSNNRPTETARRCLEKALLPKSAHQIKEESSAVRQQQNQAKMLERKVQNELLRKEESRDAPKTDKRFTDVRKNSQEGERVLNPMHNQRLEKNQEREQEPQKQKQEEEGFAENERQQRQNSDEEDTAREGRVEKVEKSLEQELESYAAEDSILSELFNRRVSQFDVLILFIEILKLDIKSREQEKLARKQERELQLLHLQKICDNYKSQGKWSMFSSLGSGVLAIISGICPIVGHVGGKWMLDKLGSFSLFEKLRDMKPKQFFEGASKITFAMSEMYKSTGQIHNTFAEGHRNFDQQMSDLHRMDWEENTRSLEEIKDNWKGIENFLYQALQMYHDSIRQLYNR